MQTDYLPRIPNKEGIFITKESIHSIGDSRNIGARIKSGMESDCPATSDDYLKTGFGIPISYIQTSTIDR